MKQIALALLTILILVGCQNEKPQSTEVRQKEIQEEIKARQAFELAGKQIKNNDPAGLLKLWAISTESMSAEDSEIASEQVRGYLYSKPELWIRAFSTLEFNEFKKHFEAIDFDTYRFTPDGELPQEVVAKKVVARLKKMKGKSHQEQVLIDYLITYYSPFLKSDKQSQ